MELPTPELLVKNSVKWGFDSRQVESLEPGQIALAFKCLPLSYFGSQRRIN